jgi:hypothetical protein
MAAASGRARTLAIGLGALVGVLILYFAVPRTIAAVLLMPGDRPLHVIQNGRLPPAREIEEIVSSRSAALHWVEQGRLLSDRSLARLTLAEQAANDAKPDPGKLEEVARDLTAGLSLEPVNPHAWARLAYVRFLQKGLSADAGVASALRLSFLTGPYEPEMTFPRLRLALAVWSNFSTEDRELGRRQIRFAWLLSRDEVVDLAVQSQRILVFRLALVGQPQDLAIFDSMLKERSS